MEEKRTNTNIPNNISTGGKKGKRKKLRLKKSVRRTAGALLMVTSLIVAAIPTGSASADTASGDPFANVGGSTITIPTIENVLKTPYAKYQSSSVPDATSEDKIGTYQVSVVQDGDEYKPLTINIGGRTYYEVDLTGFTEKKLKKPIFEVYRNGGIKAEESGYVISKYIKSGDYSSSTITLNSKIGFNTGTTKVVDEWLFNDQYFIETTEPKTVLDQNTNTAIPYVEVRIDTCEKATFNTGGIGGGLFEDIESYNDDSNESIEYLDNNSDAENVIDDSLSDDVPVIDDSEDNTNDLEPVSTPSPTPSPTPTIVPEDNSNINDKMNSDEDSIDNSEETDIESNENTIEEKNENITEAYVITENKYLTYYGASIPNWKGALKVADEGDEVYYTVTFVDFSGNTFKSVKVKKGDLCPEPETKPTSDNYKFAGWAFNLKTEPITQNTVIYPQYWNVVSTDIVCKNVGTVNFIGEKAFSGEPGLTTIEIPDYSRLTEIGESAFEGNVGISTINLGRKLQQIDKNAFAGCTGLLNVNYKADAELSTICDGAFNGTGISSFVPPASVKKIGSGAFYGCNSLTFLNLENLVSCEFGHFVFANCQNQGFNKVDLETKVDSGVNISNLADIEGLFAGCESLTEVSLAKSFNGTLKYGTFADCPMTLLRVRNYGADFADGEFDKEKIIVEGPIPDFKIPGVNLDSIEPSNDCNVKSYKTCMKEVNDYTYRYRVDANTYYDYVNYSGVYDHTDTFIEEHEADQKHENPTEHSKPKTLGMIFKISNDGDLLKIHDRNSEYNKSTNTFTEKNAIDLEIYDRAGNLGNPIISISSEVFKGIPSIRNLVINNNIYSIGNDAFNGCSNISELWINTNQSADGITLGNQVFYKNGALKKVTFSSDGSGKSSIGKLCFGDTTSLVEVNFLDDDYKNGNVRYNVATGEVFNYADFSSIANDAFLLSNRTNTITFKGPMKKDYIPYEMAVSGSIGYISNETIYPLYTTGNPQNLSCQFKKQFVGDGLSRYDIPSSGNPHTGGEKGKTYVDGVYLLSYPNQTTSVTNKESRTIEDIQKDRDAGVVIPNIQSDCVDATHNVWIPYGIDYIDIAESKINNSAYKYTFFTDKDSSGNNVSLYQDIDTTSYRLFKYTAGLETVTFEDGSPEVFPNRMFEHAPDLKSVAFNGNVKDLGDLPFFWGDSEDVPDTTRGIDTYFETFLHTKASPSKVASVTFNAAAEGTASASDPVYSCEPGSGIIKSDDGSVITLEQILPGRGSAFGATKIGKDELASIGAFKEYAARDCDSIDEVDLSSIVRSTDIVNGVFYDCDNLAKVTMPTDFVSLAPTAFAYISSNLDVTFPGEQYGMQKDIFDPASEDKTSLPKVKFFIHRGVDSLEDYANKYANISLGEYLPENITIEYRNYDGTLLKSVNVMTPTYGVNNFSSSDPQPSRSGSIFAGWKAVDSAGNDVDFNTTPLFENTTFTAQFTDDTITITFVDHDSTVLKTVPNVPAGANTYGYPYRPQPDPTRAGYTFTGYKGNDVMGNVINDYTTEPLYYNTTFVAQYSQGTITIYFNDFDGTNIYTAANVPGGDVGSRYKPADPTRQGYTFTGWTGLDTQGNIITDIDRTVLNYTTTFTAQYGTGKLIDVKFYGADGEIYSKQKVPEGSFATKPAVDPIKNGYTFLQWSPDVDTSPIYDGEPNVFMPIFVKNSSTTTTTPTPTGTGTPTPTPTKGVTSSSSAKSSTVTVTSPASGSGASIATPYYVTSQDAAPIPQSTTIIINNGGNGNGGNGGSNSNGSNNGNGSNGNGNARVESTRDGISDTDKMTATVNGSTDNYVVKITRTQEADDCALAALQSAFGDITPIRYLPFDISLYDSTGTNKISPLPEGVTVSLTMPIPDDLAVYGGNAKIASTVGGTIEALQPRFTMINGVPCMNFTATHLSPYMIYVDTANLTEAGISDVTPKTADPIHPKWFLCIGLAAIALVLLIKKDPEEYIKSATA